MGGDPATDWADGTGGGEGAAANLTQPYLADRKAAVYRCFDGHGVLLYVGAAMWPEQRIAQHARTKAWWPLMTNYTLTWYPGTEQARSAEREAIRHEMPLHNKIRYRTDTTAAYHSVPIVPPALECDIARVSFDLRADQLPALDRYWRHMGWVSRNQFLRDVVLATTGQSQWRGGGASRFRRLQARAAKRAAKPS